MTITAHAPRPDTMPDPIQELEGQMSYGQIFEGISSEIQANNGVPTVGQLLEAQSAAADLKPKYQTEYETGQLRISHYVCPDGSQVSARTGDALKSVSDISRWVQSERLERDFSNAANALHWESERADDYLERLLPVIDHATRHLNLRSDLNAEALDRLAALSRYARSRLQEKGVNITKLLNDRDRAVARGKVGAASRSYSHEERETPPYGIPVVRTADSNNGRFIGRAAVLDPETGEHVPYPEYIKPGDVVLDWFLRRGLGKKDVMPTLKSLTIGTKSTNRIGAHLPTKSEDLYSLSEEQLATARATERRLAIFERMEKAVKKGGAMPSPEEIAATMYPEREGDYHPDDILNLETARARLQYSADRYAKKDHFASLRHTRSDAMRWFRQTKERLSEFADRFKPRAVRAAQLAGAITVSAAVIAVGTGGNPLPAVQPGGVRQVASASRED